MQTTALNKGSTVGNRSLRTFLQKAEKLSAGDFEIFKIESQPPVKRVV